jgi:hypothetical protein
MQLPKAQYFGFNALLVREPEERAQALAHRDSLKADVDCLRQLVQDARMRGAYAILTSEFIDDRQ